MKLGKTVRQARWWAADYAYAARMQLVSLLPASAEAYRQGHKAPVVIIPGIYESWRFLVPMIQALHGAGHPVHVITLLQHNRVPVPRAATIVADYLYGAGLNAVILVAHSKGGLIGKYLMLNHDPDARVDRLIAVCAPFAGSRYARYMMLPSLRAFSPTDVTLSRLTQELSVNERITSIYGHFDPHIPDGSHLPGATNVRVDAAGHFRILADPDTIRAVLQAAEDPAA